MDGQSKLGSYRLIAELGHGGMADVYLAAVEGPVGAGFTKLVVVKKLRPHLAEDPDFVAMLMDEARLTSRLSHPNVVQLFEVGHVDGEYFLAIEYLDGKPLHRIEKRAQRNGALMPTEIHYAIISDVLAGLEYSHALADYDGTPLEVVHRDVTPHNIFVTYDGTVKVVDFGIAKAVGRVTVTRHGIVKGKIRYMSPEQVAGVVDRRTDIFATGVILWNAATGTKLWGDLDDMAVARALHAGHYPASPRDLCPEVPEAIDAICRKALAVQREDRYQTAEQMRADLELFLGRASADARTKLAIMMKELFERDRAKLRAVLEKAGLNSVASVVAFTAAAGIPVKAVGREARAASAMPVPAPPAAATASAPPVVVPPPSNRALVAPTARVRSSTAAVIALAVLCVVVVAAARVVTVNSSRPRVARDTAVVESDMTISSDQPRLRTDDPSEPDDTRTAPVQRALVRPRHPPRSTSSVTTRPASSSRGDTSTPNVPSLDGTDPWTSGRSSVPAR